MTFVPLSSGYYGRDHDIDMESFILPNKFVGFYSGSGVLGSTWGINGLGCQTIIKLIESITGRKSEMLFQFYDEPLEYVVHNDDICFQLNILGTPITFYPSTDTVGKIDVRMTIQYGDSDAHHMERKKQCNEFVNELIYLLQGGNSA